MTEHVTQPDREHVTVSMVGASDTAAPATTLNVAMTAAPEAAGQSDKPMENEATATSKSVTKELEADAQQKPRYARDSIGERSTKT